MVGHLLEARDVELERFLRDFGGCHSDFEYKHRWPQVLPTADSDLTILMETHMTELENVFASDNFGCRVEIPYRWPQIAPLFFAKDPKAAVLLNENDWALETALSSCSCGGGG